MCEPLNKQDLENGQKKLTLHSLTLEERNRKMDLALEGGCEIEDERFGFVQYNILNMFSPL